MVILNHLIVSEPKYYVNSITEASLYHICNIGSLGSKLLSGALKLLTIALVLVTLTVITELTFSEESGCDIFPKFLKVSKSLIRSATKAFKCNDPSIQIHYILLAWFHLSSEFYARLGFCCIEP